MILVVPPLPTSFQLLVERREAFHCFWGWRLPGWQQVSQCTPQIRNSLLAGKKIRKGGGVYPLTDKIRKVVFDPFP